MPFQNCGTIAKVARKLSAARHKHSVPRMHGETARQGGARLPAATEIRGTIGKSVLDRPADVIVTVATMPTVRVSLIGFKKTHPSARSARLPDQSFLGRSRWFVEGFRPCDSDMAVQSEVSWCRTNLCVAAVAAAATREAKELGRNTSSFNLPRANNRTLS